MNFSNSQTNNESLLKQENTEMVIQKPKDILFSQCILINKFKCKLHLPRNVDHCYVFDDLINILQVDTNRRNRTFQEHTEF